MMWREEERHISDRPTQSVKCTKPTPVYKVTLLLLDVYDRSNYVLALFPKEEKKAYYYVFKEMVQKQLR